ncbi:MAG TPA: DUF4920 domain-containing protein [Cyclobacteriaceae bacterium]|jgi:hypothetical protein
MKRTITVLSICLSFAACTAEKSSHKEHEDPAIETEAISQKPESKTGIFGLEVSREDALDVASVYLTELAAEGVEVKVKGEILEVCQSMGCWVTLKLPDNKSVRVSTDHKFTVPKDISGYTAIVQGMLNKKITSVEDLRHYAEDAGKDAAYINSITEPEEEYSIDAVGILVLEQEG